MNKKTLFMVLLVAISLILVSMASFADGPAQGKFSGRQAGNCYYRAGDRQPLGQQNNRINQERQSRGMMGMMDLDLSQDQIDQINQIMLDSQKETLQLRNQMQLKQLEMKELRLASKVDLEQVRTKLQEIADLQVELRMKAIEKQDKIKEVLTDEQLQNCPLGFPMQGFNMGMGKNSSGQGFKGGCGNLCW